MVLKSDYLTFSLVALFALVLLQPYAGYDFLTSDDFLPDPQGVYVRDGRWAVIPLLAPLDQAFGYQQFARPLAGLMLSAAIAALATMVSQPWASRAPLRGVLALVTALALLSAPNLLWAGGMWYSAIAFLGVSVSLGAITQIVRRDGERWVVFSFVWLGGLVVTFHSYQPFASLPLIMWALTASVVPFRRGGSAVWAFYLVPIFGALAVALASAVFDFFSPSSRLDQALDETGTAGVNLQNLLTAYGRPEQALLITTAAIFVALLTRRIVVEKGTFPLTIAQAMVVGVGVVAVVVIPPLFLQEARQERFALSILISIVVGLLLLLGAPGHGSASGATRPQRMSNDLVIALVVLGTAAGALALVGQQRSSFLVLGALSVGAILLVFVAMLGWKTLVTQGALLLTLALLAVGFAHSRVELHENRLALDLDRQLAGDIVWELSRAPLSTTETVTVLYEVVGPPQWYSPLLRPYVSGPEVLQNYFSALNSVDFEVVVVKQQCPELSEAGVSTAVVSATEVLVCVRTRAESPPE